MANFKVSSKVSIYDLQYDFFFYTRGNQEPNQYKERILQVFTDALLNQWCSDDIYNLMNSLIDSEEGLTIETLEKHLKEKPPKNNILLNSYRTHKEMQLKTAFPKLKDNLENIKNLDSEIVYDHYVEPRFSFSKDDLLEYIHRYDRFMNIENISDDDILNITQRLLKEVDINVILAAFDTTKVHNIYRKRLMENFNEIEEYIPRTLEGHLKRCEDIKNGDMVFNQIPREFI